MGKYRTRLERRYGRGEQVVEDVVPEMV